MGALAVGLSIVGSAIIGGLVVLAAYVIWRIWVEPATEGRVRRTRLTAAPVPRPFQPPTA